LDSGQKSRRRWGIVAADQMDGTGHYTEGPAQALELGMAEGRQSVELPLGGTLPCSLEREHIEVGECLESITASALTFSASIHKDLARVVTGQR
jgi:hypothetical protein